MRQVVNPQNPHSVVYREGFREHVTCVQFVDAWVEHACRINQTISFSHDVTEESTSDSQKQQLY